MQFRMWKTNHCEYCGEKVKYYWIIIGYIGWHDCPLGKISKEKFPTIESLFKAYLDNVDDVPHHFHMHVVHAAEIIGYKHPVSEIRNQWLQFYLECAKDLHLNPETEERMDKRLGDSRDKWLASGRETLV